MPVLLAFGDADATSAPSAVQFFDLLGGGRKRRRMERLRDAECATGHLPSATHYTVFSSPQLASVVTQFLDSPIKPTQ